MEVKRENAPDLSKLDFASLTEITGLTKDDLVKMKQLDTLGQYWGAKTDVVPMTIKFTKDGEERTIKTSGRLSVRTTEDGSLKFNLHQYRPQPDFEREFIGHKFSPEEIQMLKDTCTLGKVVELQGNGKEPFKAYVGVDPTINEICYMRAERIRLPEELCGHKFSEEEKTKLLNGETITVTGLVSKNQKTYDAHFQVNPAKNGLDMVFPNNLSLENRQNNTLKRDDILGVKLTDDQKKALNRGEFVLINGMTSKKDPSQKFDAEVRVNLAKGDLIFVYPKTPKQEQGNQDKTQKEEQKTKQSDETKNAQRESKKKSTGKKM